MIKAGIYIHFPFCTTKCIYCDFFSLAQQEKYIPEMMKLVKRLGGKVTGEHGIGILKKEFVEENDKKILKNIKKRTDSKNKFNVGKLI